jgi:hypothetical protein
MLAGGRIDSHPTDGIADACVDFGRMAVPPMMVSVRSGAASASVRSNLLGFTHHPLHHAP